MSPTPRTYRTSPSPRTLSRYPQAQPPSAPQHMARQSLMFDRKRSVRDYMQPCIGYTFPSQLTTLLPGMMLGILPSLPTSIIMLALNYQMQEPMQALNVDMAAEL